MLAAMCNTTNIITLIIILRIPRQEQRFVELEYHEVLSTEIREFPIPREQASSCGALRATYPAGVRIQGL